MKDFSFLLILDDLSFCTQTFTLLSFTFNSGVGLVVERDQIERGGSIDVPGVLLCVEVSMLGLSPF